MKRIFLFAFMLIVLSFVSVLTMDGAIPAEERAALIAFYNATNGDSWWTNTGWKTPPLDTDGFAMPGTENTWYGITVAADHVTEIALLSRNLDGTIPPELGNLSHLQSLSLSYNPLSGSIPPQLGNLSNLMYLSLNQNQLSGSIPPELGNLSNLKLLSLPGNQLSGSIPPGLGNLSHLESLWLNVNQLSGSIPPQLGNLGNLSHIYLNHNQLTGSIPPELGNLNNLESFNLHNNQLSGSIPPELGNLTNLQKLNLDENQLTGSIPPELGNLNQLFDLSLDQNQLSGSIPPELGNLSNLGYLDLQQNQLSGSIPPELGNLNVIILDLSHNQLSGSIPPGLENLSSVLQIYLNNNQLSGTIPPELGNIGTLKYLYLDNNQLSGSITPELENLSNLSRLILSHNQLSGSIPTELGNISTLTYLHLDNNQLSGTIPPQLNNLTKLWMLYLNDNQFTGTIPPEWGTFTSLRYLDLGNNRFSGNIPPELGNPVKLLYLHLDNNQFSGSIPTELGNLSELRWLHLSNNQLNGSIPPELGNLSDLEEMFLDGNQLSGSIPPGMGNLSNLEELHLNGNRLSGSVPSSLGNLSNLLTTGTDIGYNALYTTDETLRVFLNYKDSDWEDTQTIAPVNLSAVPLTPNSAGVSWTPITYTGDTGGYEVYSGTASGGPWTYRGITTDKTATSYSITGLNPGATYYFVVKTRTNAHSNNSNAVISEYSEEVSTSTPVHWPAINVNRTHLNFGYVIGGNGPGSQTFTISSTYGILNWTASGDVSWLNVSPSSGTGSGVLVTVSVDPLGLSSGKYVGAIAVSDPNAGNSPQTIPVELTVHKAGTSDGPFGEFSTPIDGAVIRGSIAVTGWALDNVGVENVKIYREEDENFVYIGDAVFVEGARPDVEQAFPDYPMNYRAGWGYMMLTNFLPDGGNGTFKIHAIAFDTDGNSVDLGTKTITCDNANAVEPFGAIDTPAQGGTASGSNYRNQGWVLTPPPNAIPTDGSTINVYIDGVYMGHPNYNFYRSDIAELFPGYANSNGAHAYFDFDTTAYENGVHTIYWTATDDAGNSDGIGSRYFTIQNSQGARSREQGAGSMKSRERGAGSREKRMACLEPVGIIKGYVRGMKPQTVYPDDNGMINIEIKQLERLEIHLSAGFVPGAAGVLAPPSIWTAYHVVGDELRALPIGSFLDMEKGIFYWQAGPAFIGDYWFLFVVKEPNGAMSRKDIKVTIRSKKHHL